MDDITASIIVTCQTAGAVAGVDKLKFAFGMLAKQALEFGAKTVKTFQATQDATWKFEKTFKNSMGAANKAVDEFMESYNLSEQTAKSMLTDTAQVLKGMGFAEEEALKVSESVSRWGVDLASFTGYAGGAKGAVEAITAAMLGENERLKGLGIVIREDSTEYRELVKSISEQKGISEQTAAAYAKLELITRKAADAQGDYVAEGENFTQTMNIVDQMWVQFKSDIGEIIYQMLGLNEVFGGVGANMKKLAKWWRENKDEIITIGKLTISEVIYMFDVVWQVTKNVFANIATAVKAAWDFLKLTWEDAPGFWGAIWKDIEQVVTDVGEVIRVSGVGLFDVASVTLTSFGRNWRGIFDDLWEITKRTFKSIGIFIKDVIVGVFKVIASLGVNFWDFLLGKKSFSEAAGDFVNDFGNVVKTAAENQKKIWQGFEMGESSKQFARDVAAASSQYARDVSNATAKIREIGTNSSAYIKKNVTVGEWTDIAAGFDEAAKRREERAKKITTLVEKSSEQAKKMVDIEKEINDNILKRIGILKKENEERRKTFDQAATEYKYAHMEALGKKDEADLLRIEDKYTPQLEKLQKDLAFAQKWAHNKYTNTFVQKLYGEEALNIGIAIALLRKQKDMELDILEIRKRKSAEAARANALESISADLMLYRSTVQQAITSNSAEGIALQSRILVNSSVSTEQNSAKETAANTKQMVQRLLALQTEIHQLRTAMTANGIKVSGITGHRY